MSFTGLPSELILLIGEQLPAHDVRSLTIVSRRLYFLLGSRLRSLATLASYSLPALYWAVLNNNPSLVEHILSAAPNITIFKSHHHHASIVVKSPARCDPATLDWIMCQRGRLRLVDIAPLKSMTALSWAIVHEHYPLLKLVLETAAYEYPAAAIAALLQAAQMGRGKVVRIFMEHGVSSGGSVR